MSYVAKNYMEVCVENTIQEEIKFFNCCSCEKCCQDIAAVALNVLPNAYYGFDGEYEFEKIKDIQKKYGELIIQKIDKAIKIVSTSPKHIEKSNKINLQNYMEICVENAIDKIIEQSNACDCEKCRVDVMVIALNNLSSKYVATKKGELYSKLNALESQYDVTIIAEITKAINIVKAEKRHG